MVAEQVVVAIDENQAAFLVGVVAGEIGVALDHGGILSGVPFTALDHERNRLRDKRQAAGVVPVQVGEDDHRRGVEVNLLGDAQVLLKREQVHRVRSPVEGGRISDGVRVQTGVDQDPLLVGLDEVGRDGVAERLVERLATAEDPGGRGKPADVEQLHPDRR